MKKGWYEDANYIERTKGISEENFFHMFTEELNAKYGCETHEEFCEIFDKADKEDPIKHMQMIVDLGPHACEISYQNCDLPEHLDCRIQTRIRVERENKDNMFYGLEMMPIFDRLERGEFEKLPHGRQVQITYVNIILATGMRQELGLEKKNEAEIKRSNRHANRTLAEAQQKLSDACKIEERGRKMLAESIKKNGSKVPSGRQKQQLRALGFMA